MYIKIPTLNRYLTILFFLAIQSLFYSCAKETAENNTVVDDDTIRVVEPVEIDLEQIKEKGKLTALIDNNSFSYFLYKGKPMGFEYELLQMLAEELKVELEIITVKDIGEMFNMLNRGEGDIIAHNLTITKNRKKYIDFTDYLVLTKQVLIQKKPNQWRQMKLHEIEQELIRTPLDLIGKEVVVRKNSSFYKRLVNLSDEIGGDIIIKEAEPSAETDELILRVAQGEIKYTVADKNVAQIIANEMADIDIRVELSTAQKIAWGVRKTSPELKKNIDGFLRRKKQEPTFNVIYRKYFSEYNRKDFKSVLTQYESELSNYDEILKKGADKLGWDWLLLASVAFQESRFDPKAESWTGAKGLMQIMPATAKSLGYNSNMLFDPNQNLNIAIKYFERLDKMWAKTISDSTQRIKFVLASYNVGPGHVIDARNLARKFNMNPIVWDENVEVMLLKKAYKKYYTDEVVKNGYCKCYEPYNYVREIYSRYKSYRQLTTPKVEDLGEIKEPA